MEKVRALTSSSTLAVGQSFRQLFTIRSAPRVISSLAAESPTIRSFEHLWCRYRDSRHACPAREEDSGNEESKWLMLHISPLKVEITMASRDRNTESSGIVALKLRQCADISIV
jgi:hypothetical protein